MKVPTLSAIRLLRLNGLGLGRRSWRRLAYCLRRGGQLHRRFLGHRLSGGLGADVSQGFVANDVELLTPPDLRLAIAAKALEISPRDFPPLILRVVLQNDERGVFGHNREVFT